MGSDHPFSWDGADLVLSVKVTPGAASEEILPGSDFIRVKLHVPAQDGKANKRLARVLGKLFGVPQSHVILEQGRASSTKRIRVLAPARLPAFIGR